MLSKEELKIIEEGGSCRNRNCHKAFMALFAHIHEQEEKLSRTQRALEWFIDMHDLYTHLPDADQLRRR